MNTDACKPVGEGADMPNVRLHRKEQDMSKQDGGPVFPTLERGSAGLELTQSGMTLRDYFAAKALLGFICEPVEGVQESVAFELSEKTCATFSKGAYMFADAMLAERAK